MTRFKKYKGKKLKISHFTPINLTKYQRTYRGIKKIVMNCDGGFLNERSCGLIKKFKTPRFDEESPKERFFFVKSPVLWNLTANQPVSPPIQQNLSISLVVNFSPFAGALDMIYHAIVNDKMD